MLAELPMKRVVEEEPVVEKNASLKMACKTINEEEEPRQRERESLCSFVFSCNVVWRRKKNGFHLRKRGEEEKQMGFVK